MNFNTKVFFTLFPKGYWILVGIGIVLHFLEENSHFGNVLINAGSFLLAFKAAVIIHEAGHYLQPKQSEVFQEEWYLEKVTNFIELKSLAYV